MAAKFWSAVAVAMQSALGAAKTITGITKASPAVVTSTAHGLSNGAYVQLKIVGMSELDYRVCRIANVAANTFELEDIDSTNFGTFSSGTAEEITFGIAMTTAVSVNVSGGDWETTDLTTIHDSVRKVAPTVASPLEFNFDCLWDPADAALVAFKAASDIKAVRAVRITFSDSTRICFAGYVGASLTPTGSAQETVKTSVKITAFGKTSTYAS